MMKKAQMLIVEDLLCLAEWLELQMKVMFLSVGLIDSGSSVTTICESFFDSLECQPLLRDINDFGVSVVAADGSPVPYKGYIEADISVPF